MPRAQTKDQLGLDEEVHDDPALEAALEEREKRKASAGAVQKLYKAADELARAELARLELEDGDVARVGRFRITKSALAGHLITKSALAGHLVTFETKPSSRIRIGLVGEDDAKPAVAEDEADLRATGEVNADALRGEVERATIPEPTQLRPGGRNAGRNASRGPLPPVN